MRACGMLYVSRSRSQCTSLPAIYFLSRWPFRSWPATMPYVCHLPGMERNGGTAHSATGSVSSPATCNPSWTALAACTGGEGADAYAGEGDVEVSAGVCSVVITCGGEGLPWGLYLPTIFSTIEVEKPSRHSARPEDWAR